MKTSLLVLCVCFMALVSAPANAAPGAIELPASGQTTCFDAAGDPILDCTGTGQDGDLLAGIRWPDPRLTDNGKTITDNLTGLMWLKDANCITSYPGVDSDGLFPDDGNVFWPTALDFVNGINDDVLDPYPLCGAGYRDWRLPNVNEIKSLVDYGMSNKALPFEHTFANVRNTYWSSTTHSLFRANAFGVSMDDGRVSMGTKSGGAAMAIWPVRDSGTAGVVELPQTRQAHCYDAVGTELLLCANTGQDAEYAKGVAWPDPRFTANGDGTVTDNLTGLIWLANVMDCMGADLWANALDTVAGLNDNPTPYHDNPGCNYTGNHDDWRLANIRELESIVHYDFAEEGAVSTADWLNTIIDVGFKTVEFFHWSSTNDVGVIITGKAFTYTMAALSVSTTYDKDTSNYLIWPVRGGVYGDPDIGVTPATIDFGEVAVGSSADRDITITNEGTYYLALDTIAAPAAPFSITVDGCSALDLYPGDSCTVTVHYEPTAEGASSDGVNVTSDDPDEATVAVSLSGTGTVAAAEAEPNNPPAAFDLVYPADGATGLSMPVTMIWKATTDPDGDPITYDVVYCEDNTFATCTPMTNIASVNRESRWMKFAKGWATALVTGPFSLMGCGGGSTATVPTDETPSVNADESSYQATDLNPGTTYYWKVTANDANGGATESAVWSFTTE